MRRLIPGLCVISVIFLISVPALAQTSSDKFAINVTNSSNDPIGSRLAYQLRDQIQRSSLMKLDKDGDPRIEIFLVTLAGDENRENLGTVYSVVWVAYDGDFGISSVYLTQSVGQCGTNKVEQCAAGLVADTYSEVQFMQEMRSK